MYLNNAERAPPPLAPIAKGLPRFQSHPTDPIPLDNCALAGDSADRLWRKTSRGAWCAHKTA